MKKRLIHGFIALAVICLAILIDGAIRGPKAKQHQASLVEAFRSIPDVSDASVTASSSEYKASNGSAERRLVSGLPVSEVRTFYLKTLEQQGWVAGCEKFIGDRDRIVFVRDKDTAVLDLPKLDSQVTGQYLLQLSWGIDYC
jgi:hypothetical protein